MAARPLNDDPSGPIRLLFGGQEWLVTVEGGTVVDNQVREVQSGSLASDTAPSSATRQNLFWVDAAGRERRTSFEGRELPCRQGHEIALVSLRYRPDDDPYLAYAFNWTTDERLRLGGTSGRLARAATTILPRTRRGLLIFAPVLLILIDFRMRAWEDPSLTEQYPNAMPAIVGMMLGAAVLSYVYRYVRNRLRVRRLGPDVVALVDRWYEGGGRSRRSKGGR